MGYHCDTSLLKRNVMTTEQWQQDLNDLEESENAVKNVDFILQEAKIYFDSLKETNTRIKENTHKLLYILYLIIAGESGAAIHFLMDASAKNIGLGILFLIIAAFHILIAIVFLIPNITPRDTLLAGYCPKDFCEKKVLESNHFNNLKGYIVEYQWSIDEENKTNKALGRNLKWGTWFILIIPVAVMLFAGLIFGMLHNSAFTDALCRNY